MLLEKSEEMNCQFIWDKISPGCSSICRFKAFFRQKDEMDWILKQQAKMPINLMRQWKEVMYQAYEAYPVSEKQDKLYWSIINRIKDFKNDDYDRFAYSMIIKGNHYSDEVFSDMKTRFKKKWLEGFFCHYYRNKKISSEDICELLEHSKISTGANFRFISFLYNPNYINEKDIEYILEYCQYDLSLNVNLNTLIHCPNVTFKIIKKYIEKSPELDLVISASSWRKLALLTKKMNQDEIIYLLSVSPKLAEFGVKIDSLKLSIELLE